MRSGGEPSRGRAQADSTKNSPGRARFEHFGDIRRAERQERKTKLQEYYQSRLVQRLEEKEKDRLKRLEYLEWVKSFQREKPLELEREEEFRMRVLIPELEEQHKKLMTIKAEHRPIDPEDLADHEEKYLEFKKDNAIRKRA